MPLKLMYITNRSDVVKIAEAAGVDRIFVDMEYIGKAERQGGMDTVQNHHTIYDIENIRGKITSAELLVRCNPIHEETEEYCSSKEEIDAIVANGADIIMLPYFKTVDEVEQFVTIVDGRAKTLLLIETPEAVQAIDEILDIPGIDEVFVGLNDLSLGYGQKFMFEPLADGTVEKLCCKFKEKGVPYGFGGIASLGKGRLPSEKVIAEHYRLGSTCAILSRSFCNVNYISDLDVIRNIFVNGIREIRDFEELCEKHVISLENNKEEVKNIVERIKVKSE